MKNLKLIVEKTLEGSTTFNENTIRESLNYCDTFTNLVVKKNMDKENYSEDKITSYLEDLTVVESNLNKITEFENKEIIFVRALLEFISDKKELKTKFNFNFLENVFLQQTFKKINLILGLLVFLVIPFTFYFNSQITTTILMFLGGLLILSSGIVLYKQYHIELITYSDLIKLCNDTQYLESVTKEFEKYYVEFYDTKFNLNRAKSNVNQVKSVLTSHLKGA